MKNMQKLLAKKYSLFQWSLDFSSLFQLFLQKRTIRVIVKYLLIMILQVIPVTSSEFE